MGPTVVIAQRLADTAHALVGSGKGLLAMDESIGTCDKRFAAEGIQQTQRSRRAYRELLVTTADLGSCISGAILYDETIRQSTMEGLPFIKVLTEAGILAGIKVDIGAKSLAGHTGEIVTRGLDGLRQRLSDYAAMGARFAKWRAVLALGEGLPSQACISANAEALAGYAALCQEAGLVPIVEPEGHDLERCRMVTEEALHTVFGPLYAQGVLLEGLILKPNMILPGLDSRLQPSAGVAATTITSLLRVVPSAVAGIAFLSGGQSAELASARLNAMNVRAKAMAMRVPWPLVFSFARAIQRPALHIWNGEGGNVARAQAALFHRANFNRAALRGDYSAEMQAV